MITIMMMIKELQFKDKQSKLKQIMKDFLRILHQRHFSRLLEKINLKNNSFQEQLIEDLGIHIKGGNLYRKRKYYLLQAISKLEERVL